MANFPGADPSFSAKSAGQSIQHEHVNDLQDEVVAIGSDVRGTMAHGVTIGSTYSLNVTSGNSTLGGNLQVTGTSTFASRPVMPPTEVVSLTGSTTNLASNSTTALTWPTQTIALNSSVHSTTTNPERLTPQTTGVYVITATLKLQAAFTAGSTQKFDAQMLDSSGGTLDFQIVGGLDGAPIVALSGVKRFDTIAGSTQWVRITARQRTGSSGSLDGAFSFLRWMKLS